MIVHLKVGHPKFGSPFRVMNGRPVHPPARQKCPQKRTRRGFCNLAGQGIGHRRSDEARLERRQSWYLRRWADGMICKTDGIRAAWATGDRIGALRIAARFFDRSADTKTFKRGMDAFNYPDFYRQIGKEPEQITQEALETLANRFGLR